MSDILKNVIGRRCRIEGDNFYGSCGKECVIHEADDEWARLTIYDKKDTTERIVRLDSIESIELI